MNKKIVMPHDAVVKKFFSDVDIARDFLQAHLPVAVKQHCDFRTLKMASGSFIEDDLRHCCSDMLYSVTMTQNAGYIYCLVEHQSSHDKHMAFRLLRYSIAAMQQHLSQGYDNLPIVIPVLLYQGEKSPYPDSLHWLDCFSNRTLAEQVYLQAFPLVDLTVIADEELLTHKKVALLELVLKHVRARDDFLLLAQLIAQLLNQYPPGNELFKAIMYYICQEAEISDTRKFITTLAAGSDREATMGTMAQYFEEQGIHKGRQEGEKEASLKIARQLLASGVEPGIVKLSTGLSDAELDNLNIHKSV
jgi:predicted transposase/invertase (TIGR01784 family)